MDNPINHYPSASTFIDVSRDRDYWWRRAQVAEADLNWLRERAKGTVEQLRLERLHIEMERDAYLKLLTDHVALQLPRPILLVPEPPPLPPPVSSTGSPPRCLTDSATPTARRTWGSTARSSRR